MKPGLKAIAPLGCDGLPIMPTFECDECKFALEASSGIDSMRFSLTWLAPSSALSYKEAGYGLAFGLVPPANLA